MKGKPLVLPIRTAIGTYFYETCRNEIVAVNERLFEYIEQKCSNNSGNLPDTPIEIVEQYDELLENGYLASGNVEEILHPATTQLANLLGRGIDKLTLQITQQCNLRCKYCIYSEGSNPNQRSHSSNLMSLEMAKAALMFYRQHTIDMDKVVIGFYGGEPLLAYSTIVQTVEYAEEIFAGKEISYNITTNGTLLTDEIIDFLLEHDFYITFSLDGPKEVQDRNRVFRDGKGSYDTVINNIRKVFAKNPDAMKRSSISMVIQPDQDYKELLTLFSEPALKEVNLIPAVVEEDSVTKRLSKQYITAFNYDAFLALVDYFRAEETQYDNPLQSSNIQGYDQNILKVKSTLLGPVSAPGGPCVPGKLKLFIDCFGNLYPCEKVDEKIGMQIGSISDGFDLKRVSEILNVGNLTPDLCKECWAFPLCTICAKRSTEDGALSASRRTQACSESRLYAYSVIMEKILVYENQQHMQRMNHLLGGNAS